LNTDCPLGAKVLLQEEKSFVKNLSWKLGKNVDIIADSNKIYIEKIFSTKVNNV
jgi:hypothetical protein